MSDAHEIAQQAHEQALAAAEAEKQAEEERRRAHERSILDRAEATFDAGVAVLREWFPGVQWEISDWRSGRGSAAGYGQGAEVIVREHDAPPGDPLKLMIERRLLDMNEPEAGYRVRVYFVSYRTDSATGYGYWDGPEVKSAADVGRCLAAGEKS